MIMIALVSAAVLLLVMGNMRTLILCGVLAGAGYFYYEQLPQEQQEQWQTTFSSCEKRLTKAWKTLVE